jgi:hypothetical protein
MSPIHRQCRDSVYGRRTKEPAAPSTPLFMIEHASMAQARESQNIYANLIRRSVSLLKLMLEQRKQQQQAPRYKGISL